MKISQLKINIFKSQYCKNQIGAGLIELMISMAIGLVLILGVSTVFFSVNNTFKFRQGLAKVQDSQRTAMSFISTGIRNAGYYPNPLAPSPIASNVILVGTGNGSGADTLAVRFVAPSGANVTPFQGCTAALTPGNTYRDTFSVSGGNLVCTETNLTTNTSTTVNLVTGLSSLNIRYGVDTTTAGSATTYRMASAMTAATWDDVKTVVVTLGFTNPLFSQPGQPANTSLTQVISSLIGP